MPEFKVKKELTGEISELRTKGKAINGTYAAIDSGDVKTLKTSMRIISQHASIKELLELYKAMVVRDVGDMDRFVREAEQMDKAISDSHTM